MKRKSNEPLESFEDNSSDITARLVQAAEEESAMRRKEEDIRLAAKEVADLFAN